jgi:hypothetical protein
VESISTRCLGLYVQGGRGGMLRGVRVQGSSSVHEVQIVFRSLVHDLAQHESWLVHCLEIHSPSSNL